MREVQNQVVSLQKRPVATYHTWFVNSSYRVFLQMHPWCCKKWVRFYLVQHFSLKLFYIVAWTVLPVGRLFQFIVSIDLKIDFCRNTKKNWKIAHVVPYTTTWGFIKSTYYSFISLVFRKAGSVVNCDLL